MSGFANPLVGGGGGLVYPSIHSPNFVTGVSGWSINKDGSAEFDDLVIRGTFNGTDWEITSAGLFFYSGTPATGNLVGSWAQSGGADDGHGNAYPEGLQVTDGAGNGIHLNTNGQLVILGTGLTTAGFLQSLGAATSADSPETFLSGASNNDVVPQVLLVGESQDGSAPAHILLAGFSLAGSDQAALDVWLVGALRWAAPGGSNDTDLYRSAAGVLKTDGDLVVGAALTATGGTAASPTQVSTDTWHDFTLASGWSAGTDSSGASYPPAYRLLPDGAVAVRGCLLTPSSGTVLGVAFNSAALAAPYVPASGANIPTAVITQATAAHTGTIEIHPNGNAELQGSFSTGENLRIDATIRVS